MAIDLKLPAAIESIGHDPMALVNKINPGPLLDIVDKVDPRPLLAKVDPRTPVRRSRRRRNSVLVVLALAVGAIAIAVVLQKRRAEQLGVDDLGDRSSDEQRFPGESSGAPAVGHQARGA